MTARHSCLLVISRPRVARGCSWFNDVMVSILSIQISRFIDWTAIIVGCTPEAMYRIFVLVPCFHFLWHDEMAHHCFCVVAFMSLSIETTHVDFVTQWMSRCHIAVEDWPVPLDSVASTVSIIFSSLHCFLFPSLVMDTTREATVFADRNVRAIKQWLASDGYNPSWLI